MALFDLDFIKRYFLRVLHIFSVVILSYKTLNELGTG